MDAEMLLEIENLGLINKANLEIGKINVIVGKKQHRKINIKQVSIFSSNSSIQ